MDDFPPVADLLDDPVADYSVDEVDKVTLCEAFWKRVTAAVHFKQTNFPQKTVQ